MFSSKSPQNKRHLMFSSQRFEAVSKMALFYQFLFLVNPSSAG